MDQEQICKLCKSHFEITDEDLKFYEGFGVPAPTLCPNCRRLRRLIFRPERTLFRRQCDMCKKLIISVYAKDAPYPVYCQNCWWSDKWDATAYAQDFDFSRPFFEQWDKLNRKVPHINLWQIQNENSEYGHDLSYNKNCYMLFGADYNRDSYYGFCLIYCNDVCDSSAVGYCERCYELLDCGNCQFCVYGQYLRDCSDMAFCFDCINCHFCFGSSGLRSKSYYWFNEALKKEEWESRYKTLAWNHGEIEENRKKAFEVSLKVPRRDMRQRNCEDSTGHNMGDCKNVKESFDMSESRDCKFCMLCYKCKDIYDEDISWHNVERCLEGHSLIKNCFRVNFSFFVRDAKEYWYSAECYASQNLFGCIGLRNQKYHILNKPYSKEEYEKLMPRIIVHMGGNPASAQREREAERKSGSASLSEAELKNKEWGEFFPMSLATVPYNETAAIDYMKPLTKEQAQALGLAWRDPDPKEYLPSTAVAPDTIRQTPDSITDEMLSCELCKRNYRITPQELKFYRDMNLPVPKQCFTCRYVARINRRGVRTLFDRACQKCGCKIKTVYAPDQPEIVYCEKCYLEAVY